VAGQHHLPPRPGHVGAVAQRPGYAEQVEKEHRWLPGFAAQLPLPVPAPLARGAPGYGFPWPWSVYRWLPGQPAATARPVELAFAADLAGDDGPA
jgi:aminoglycoside phosphotransferase (APT) family kinase protein